MVSDYRFEQYLSFSGLYGPARAWLIAALIKSKPGTVNLLITADRKKAEEIRDELNFFLGSNSKIELFPAWDTLPFESISPESDIMAQRLKVLAALIDIKDNQHQELKPDIIIAPCDALLQRVITKRTLTRLCFELRPAQLLSRDTLVQHLILCGYRSVSLVTRVSEMAVRGSVVDFFPSHLRSPVRVEFRSERIEKLRLFELNSQRSQHALEYLTVCPVSELIYPDSDNELEQAVERIKTRGREIDVPARELMRIIHALKSKAEIPGLEQLLALIQTDLSDLFEYLPEAANLIIDDFESCQFAVDRFNSLLLAREQVARKSHELHSCSKTFYCNTEQFNASLNSRKSIKINSLELSGDSSNLNCKNLRSNTLAGLNLHIVAGNSKEGSLSSLVRAIETWRRQDYGVAIIVGSKSRAARIERLLLAYDLAAQCLEISGLDWLESKSRHPLVILNGHLASSAEIHSAKAVFIAESDIFKERSLRSGIKASSIKRLLSTLSQLSEGDYIVHVDYGVGIYRGLRHLSVEGITRDFLHLEYAGQSRLYLPVESVAKIQKYIADENFIPKLDTLGSTRWAKTKAKVQAAAIELAGDLIKLYAIRAQSRGWRFEPIGAEDERFADSFPFDETPDQQKAIEDTLADMASDNPMDRLVCGDAGFGKTEVALRAAFKCVQHARQVAVLVPTTLLAEQHFRTFMERLAGYPIKVACLSRFYDRRETAHILEELSTGQIDIIIGTHKLLGSSVVFKDLGLLIVDEEHRFGVKHKERLKQVRANVDVLTLTATPIPRTLHMALLGIKDISVISTAPHDRRVIRTHLATKSDSLIRDAILRELSRSGQCFYLHNRVQTIAHITEQLTEIVPEAKFAFAHGQMEEEQIEEQMLKFIEQKTDVLVSTSIIESGLDIPNANTIIIDRADMFGLAQLYQLRGRVGRSTKQAYCYLMIPEPQKLGADARKRLKVLQSLDDLGLGFNLATHDLEIRGAGNLLGKDQSGSVQSVGLELYNKILKEAVYHLRGKELTLQEITDPEVKLGVSAYLPDHYVPDVSERLILYQRLAALLTDQEALDLRDEIEDRFGLMPNETKQLLDLMRFRALLRRNGVIKAEYNHGKLNLCFSGKVSLKQEPLTLLIHQDPTAIKICPNNTLSVKVYESKGPDLELIYEKTERILTQLGVNTL